MSLGDKIDEMLKAYMRAKFQADVLAELKELAKAMPPGAAEEILKRALERDEKKEDDNG